MIKRIQFIHTSIVSYQKLRFYEIDSKFVFTIYLKNKKKQVADFTILFFSLI